ncbi:hypothetical protein EDD17DRAFT_1770887 [Pisolithus thermaeus]|nr:hypothetical protein EDD17DRAFT_1770887 [Pisolithus thermaeus]
MSDWKQAYSEILSSYAGMCKEARGNLELRNEILAEVEGKILQHEPLHSVELPHNLRVAIRMEWLSQLDPEDQDDEIAIIQWVLALAFTGKNNISKTQGLVQRHRPTDGTDFPQTQYRPLQTLQTPKT